MIKHDLLNAGLGNARMILQFDNLERRKQTDACVLMFGILFLFFDALDAIRRVVHAVLHDRAIGNMLGNFQSCFKIDVVPLTRDIRPAGTREHRHRNALVR